MDFSYVGLPKGNTQSKRVRFAAVHRVISMGVEDPFPQFTMRRRDEAWWSTNRIKLKYRTELSEEINEILITKNHHGPLKKHIFHSLKKTNKKGWIDSANCGVAGGCWGIPCSMVGTYNIYNTWHSGIGGTVDGFRSSLPPGFEKNHRDVVHRERNKRNL